jgi:hypothetical protein
MAALYNIDMNTTMIVGSRSAEYRPYVEQPKDLLFLLGSAGTGGNATTDYYLKRQGYAIFKIARIHSVISGHVEPQFVSWMKDVKSGFERTFSTLPSIFGVSRQTLYNWLNGEEPKYAHQAKLQQLAAAARAFREATYKPTPSALSRPLTRGKSFLELIAEDSDGQSTANLLVRIVTRGDKARKALDALLGDRKKASLTADDIGLSSFREDV